MRKRLLSDKQRQLLKEEIKFKNKKNFSREELDELIILIAKKLNIIKE